MPRCLVFALLIVFFGFAPSVSSAASEDCPDGWFCEPNAAPPSSPPSQQPALPPAARPAEPAPPARPAVAPSYDPAGHPPPGQPRYEPNRAEGSFEVPPDQPPPKHRRRRGFREWGFNLHLMGALLDNQAERVDSTALGGLGFGFRYRLLPRLAFEAGIDLLRRSEHDGYSRTEAAFLLNTLLFFNPRDVVQIYALGGLAFSGANVSIAPRSGEAYFKRRDEHYSYFGGQLGLGVEVRVSRRIAIAGDLLGFIRGRNDERWDETPEYIDYDTQRSSKTSGGGVLRAGVTFYW